MFSTLFSWEIIILFCLQNSLSELSEHPNSNWKIDIRTHNVGRIKYENGEINLFQNQDKPTNFFFTPFPLVNPSNSKCHQNMLSGYIELSLSVDLYTSKLIETIETYLKEQIPTLCDQNSTCHISMLPMNVIGLIQKGLRTNQTEEMYKIHSDWFPNTIFLQSINFPIYTMNKSICEHLLSSLIKNCFLSNFEIHYSLQPEKLIERQIDITTEHITSTSIFNQIRSQFSLFDIVVITNNDYKQLLSEIIDKINIKLRIPEGFGSSVQDPIVLKRFIDQWLPFGKIHLNQADDKLWNSMYWRRDRTRPDRLAKIMNKIIFKNSTEFHYFHYDNQFVKNIYQSDLIQHDIDRIEELHTFVTTHRIHNEKTSDDEESKIHHIESYQLSRTDVIQYLSKLSNDIHLEREMIVPKPIDIHLIKMSTMKVERKLFSHSVLVRTRSDIHVLPLQCLLKEKINTTNHWLENQLMNLTKLVEELTNQSIECQREREKLLKSIKESNKLQIIKLKPHGITVAGGNGGGNQSNQLYFPCGFFLDDNKNLIIADYWNNRVVKWNYNSTDGEIIAGGNQRGKRYDQLDSPRDIVNEKQTNSFLICDRENRRIMRWFYYNKQYQQILINDIDCWGLAKDKLGYIYVSDWKMNEVKRWQEGERDGIIVAGGNRAGNHNNQLNYPTYIFVDKDYSIYIADSDNNRVMKWKKDAREGILVAGGNGRGNSLNQLINPRGIVVDGLSQIYIADMRNHRIVLWREGETQGSIIIGGYGQGNESYQLHYPTALAFDNEENLYVADWQNHRIQKYEQNFDKN